MKQKEVYQLIIDYFINQNLLINNFRIIYLLVFHPINQKNLIHLYFKDIILKDKYF